MSSKPMASAPLDGTRILVQSQCYQFLPEKHGSHFRVHKPIGSRWIECRWHGGEWQEWKGADSCGGGVTITPLAWADLPC